jgi:hypothetical protein
MGTTSEIFSSVTTIRGLDHVFDLRVRGTSQAGDHPFKAASVTKPHSDVFHFFIHEGSRPAACNTVRTRSGCPDRSSRCRPSARRAVAGSGPTRPPAKNRWKGCVHRANSEFAPPRQPTADSREGAPTRPRATQSSWCGRVDLNPHALASAATSRLCVCQFRHFRLLSKTPCQH